jgi:predicted DNA binding CopG/RHH family protein
VVRDSLPTPDQLVLSNNNVKVTLALSKSSIEFFKAKARENSIPYQKMIRNLLDYYAAQN